MFFSVIQYHEGFITFIELLCESNFVVISDVMKSECLSTI